MAELLRSTILLRGHSLHELTRDTGVAVPVLSRFVRGKQDLTLRTFEKLATYFDLHLCPKAGG
jgi:plasmid maintenance system antidote protein VapI